MKKIKSKDWIRMKQQMDQQQQAQQQQQQLQQQAQQQQQQADVKLKEDIHWKRVEEKMKLDLKVRGILCQVCGNEPKFLRALESGGYDYIRSQYTYEGSLEEAKELHKRGPEYLGMAKRWLWAGLRSALTTGQKKEVQKTVKLLLKYLEEMKISKEIKYKPPAWETEHAKLILREADHCIEIIQKTKKIFETESKAI